MIPDVNQGEAVFLTLKRWQYPQSNQKGIDYWPC